MGRRWPLTLRGAGALLLALGCVIAAGRVGLAELLWFALLLVALVAGCLVWVRFAPRGATVERILSRDDPAVGEEISVRLRVHPRAGAGSPAGVWEDETDRGLVGAATGAFPATAGARAVEVGYTLTTTVRGIHGLGPFTVRVGDPFGMARRTVELGGRSRLVVTPAAVELAPLGAVQGRAGGTHPQPDNRYGQGFDDLVARPWVPGDSMRRIHWRASAHRDELMVRQEERESSPDARVVFDRASERFSAAAQGAPGSDPDFETAVVVCSSVVTRLVHDGFSVDVVDATGVALCDPLPGGDESALETMRLALADVRAQRQGALTAQGAGLTGDLRGPVVIVTGHPTAEDAAALAPAASHTTLPLLLAVGAAPEALAAAQGWHARAVTSTASVADAWAAAIGEGAERARR